jgi:hypothetical protein
VLLLELGLEDLGLELLKLIVVEDIVHILITDAEYPE